MVYFVNIYIYNIIEIAAKLQPWLAVSFFQTIFIKILNICKECFENCPFRIGVRCERVRCCYVYCAVTHWDYKSVCVQHHPVWRHICSVTVHVISYNTMSYVQAMNTQLVCSSCSKIKSNQSTRSRSAIWLYWYDFVFIKKVNCGM